MVPRHGLRHLDGILVLAGVLILHCDSVDEERKLLERSRRGIRYLPEGSRLEVIQGASHGFDGLL